MSAASAPLVSVIIPAHNAAPYLPATLGSVLAQDHRPLEIIAVDDGSTDGTEHILRGCPGVVCLRQAAPAGPSAARNRAIECARGAYLAFLDADDLWPPGKLRAQVAFLEAHPDIGLVFGNARRFGDDGWTEPSLFDRYHFTREYFGHEWRVEDAVSKLLRSPFIPTSTVMTRPECLRAVGPFDERLWRSEDWDLWLRIAAQFPIAHSPVVWKLKRIHRDNLSRDTVAMARGALAVLEKLREGPVGRVAEFQPTLAAQYGGLGYLLFRALELPEARDCLRKSLLLRFTWRHLAYLVASFLGRPLLHPLLRVRG